MPQPKSSSGRSSKRSASQRGDASSRARASGGKSKGGAGGGAAGSSDDARVRQIREILEQAVVIPAERLQTVLDDARKRGHIDAKGVEDIAHGLLKQAEDVRRELEALLGRGVSNVEEVVSRATEGARAAGRRAAEAGEPLLRAVGRGERTQTETAKDKAKGSSRAKKGSGTARKGAGGGRKGAASGGGQSSSGFPIAGYDKLKAAEVVAKLDGLTAAQLRKVRKREDQGASRKTVLQAVDRKLS